MISEFFLARRYLFRGGARHISFIGVISCLGITLGVASLIIAFGVINGVDGGLMKRIMRFQDHIIIESTNQKRLSEIKDSLNNWQEVSSAHLSLQTQVFAKFNETIVPLIVQGFDFENDKELFYPYVEEDYKEGAFFAGAGLRKRYFLGDTLEFYPLESKPKLTQEKIRGFFKVGLFDIDNYYLIADLEKAKELSSNYSLFLGLRLNDPFLAKEVQEKIENIFFGEVYVDTWIDSNQALFSTLKLEKIGMFIVLSLIVIVASFNIFATLTVKVVEKTKDIGILRSLGFTKKSIRRIFTLQGMIIGAIGIWFGSLLGLGTCLLLEKYPFIRVPEDIFGTEFLPITTDIKDVITIAIAAFIISFISSIIPAHRASRLMPADSLRYE